MILTDIYILFNEEDGNNLITAEDLVLFENFEYLEYIHIITWEEDASKVIVDQNKYKVILENGVG